MSCLDGEPLNLADDFGPFGGRAWLNCAHQGPLPRVAVAAARDALELKVAPWRLAGSGPFTDVPRRLREALGRLIGAPPDDVILGNSASWGLNVLASAIPWRDGDEVLLVRGDFPATIFPWLRLRDDGVAVRFVEPAGPAVEPAELAAALSPATRLFCTSWVHSLTGWTADAGALATVCRDAGVTFVLNASQGLGCRPLDVPRCGADAVTGVGFKWLCGPYGTGFCWFSPELRDGLRPTQAYWLANLTADDLRGDFDCAIRFDLGARAYDVHGTANFNNFMPWTASIEYLLGIGLDRVAAHDAALVQRLLGGLDDARYELLSPRDGPARSSLVLLRPRGGGADQRFERLRDGGVDVALRRGWLRVSPHVHNTVADIDRLLSLLA